MTSPPSIAISDLVDRYSGFLVDAYGVLVDGSGPRPGARAFLERVQASGKPFRVVTNDASRSPEACAARYRQLGVPVEGACVLTSGGLLGTYLAAHRCGDPVCLVLGPADAHAYVRAGGWEPIGPERVDPQKTPALVIADDGGFELRAGIEAALSLAYQRREAGWDLMLLLPNPDLVYPKSASQFGYAAGALAHMLETALELRWPGDPRNRFVRLGKPAPALFEHALGELGTRDAVMIGDQLTTDVAGALNVGIDAVWVSSGVGRLRNDLPTPTYQLDSLAA